MIALLKSARQQMRTAFAATALLAVTRPVRYFARLDPSEPSSRYVRGRKR